MDVLTVPSINGWEKSFQVRAKEAESNDGVTAGASPGGVSGCRGDVDQDRLSTARDGMGINEWVILKNKPILRKRNKCIST